MHSRSHAMTNGEASMLGRLAALFALVLSLAACSDTSGGDSGAQAPAATLDALAQEYVQLALAFRAHDADYVDAYYGPAEWQQRAEQESVSLGELRSRTERTLESVARLPAEQTQVERQRHTMLEKRLRSMRLRIDMVDPERKGALPLFDEE